MIQSGRLVNTLVLLGSSTILSIIFGVVIGIVLSKKRGSAVDKSIVTTALTTYSLPTFWIGLSLILIFVLSLHWLPFPQGSYPAQWGVSGFPNLFVQFIVRLQYLFLHLLVLTIFSYGGFILLTRATMLETLNEDYIITARAKGLSERTVLFKHAFKNASLPIVTASSLSFASILVARSLLNMCST